MSTFEGEMCCVLSIKSLSPLPVTLNPEPHNDGFRATLIIGEPFDTIRYHPRDSSIFSSCFGVSIEIVLCLARPK